MTICAKTLLWECVWCVTGTTEASVSTASGGEGNSGEGKEEEGTVD